MATQTCKNCGETFKSGMSWANKEYCKACWVDGGLSSQNVEIKNEAEKTEKTKDVASGLTDVIVRDINMGFGSMVVFMVKWALASIPALIILTLFSLAIGAVAGGMFAGILG